MKKIGEKIKELRNDKGLTQENVVMGSKHNQSLVAQIEKGTIITPNEDTLRIIAGNLDISLEELLADTDWDRDVSKVKNTEYAISLADPIIHLEITGEVKVKMHTYPRYNANGEENKYCPNTGTIMLTECLQCNRAIEAPDQRHCMGCGNMHWRRDNFPNVPPGFHVSLEKNQKIVNEIYEMSKRDRPLDEAIAKNHHIGDFEPFREMMRTIIGDFIDQWNDEEILKEHLSDDHSIREFFIHRMFGENYNVGLVNELRRYASKLVEPDSADKYPDKKHLLPIDLSRKN